MAIVTPKPQTTRNRILGIHTRPDHQVAFLDTPGVVDSQKGLNAYLGREVQRALGDADVIILVVEPFGPLKESEEFLLERLAKHKRPVILAINKVDKVKKENLLPLLAEFGAKFPFQAMVPISARRKDGIDRLLSETVNALPKGPLYFPPDQLSDANERFFVAEMIREQVFLLTKEEIPYSSAVVVENFQEKEALNHIIATILVERDSQKGIVIGHGGEMLKKIGTAARRKMEAFLQKKVYLELQVRVSRDWSRSESKLRELGFQ